MRKLIALFLALALLTGCAANTGPSPAQTQPEETEAPVETIAPRQETMGLSYEPDKGLNPYSCTSVTNRVAFSLVYQGLFRVTADYKAVPVLCDSYTVSPDGLTHTFTLKNAAFSNGTAVTARDVKASLEAARGSDYYGTRLRHVGSITVNDDGALVITTVTAMEDLSILLDIPVVPAAQVDYPRPNGSGPYAWNAPDGTLTLRRVETWWGGSLDTIAYDTILLNQADSASDIRDHFEFGQTDVVCADPGSDSYVEYRCDFELWSQPVNLMLYLACNSSSKVFSNPAIRSALTHGIDRDAIVTTAYQGFGQSIFLPAAPNSPYYDDTLAAKYGYDPQKLADAVENAGMTGRSVVLLVCSGESAREKAAQLVADALTEAGLAVEIKSLTENAYRSALSEGSYDLYLGQTRLSANFDLTPFFGENGALRYGGLADSVLYSLCMSALENSGNYYHFHQAVMDGGMLCPLLLRGYAVYASRGMFPQLAPGLDSTFSGLLD